MCMYATATYVTLVLNGMALCLSVYCILYTVYGWMDECHVMQCPVVLY